MKNGGLTEVSAEGAQENFRTAIEAGECVDWSWLLARTGGEEHIPGASYNFSVSRR